MISTKEIFKKCWIDFEDSYRASNVLSDAEGAGTPSETLWCEADMQSRLAGLFADAIGVNGHDWVIREMKRRLDYAFV